MSQWSSLILDFVSALLPCERWHAASFKPPPPNKHLNKTTVYVTSKNFENFQIIAFKMKKYGFRYGTFNIFQAVRNTGTTQ